MLSENNQLIIAYEIGGYKKTDVYFIESDYNKFCEIIDELNGLVFGISKEESQKLINRSMFHN